jgi:hypothetical protein
VPIQTTKTEKIYFPDGAKVSVKASGDSSYFDVGAINSAVTATLNYDENQVDTANAGKTQKQIKNMTITGGFTLVNLDMEGVEKMGAGLFTRVVTTSSPDTTVANQVVSSGNYSDKGIINLSLVNSAGTVLRANSAPTITSVTGSVDGALAANDDYTIIVDANSPSGYSLVPNTAGTTLTTVAQDLTIVYTSVTPIADETLYAGSSTKLLTAYAMKITHTDDNGKVRELELPAVDSDSGGFQFNFKGANEEGIEEMPLTYTARLDTTLTNDRQLMSWRVQANAQ